MYKLIPILNEIRIIGKITPEMVHNLWNEKLEDMYGSIYSKTRLNLRKKYLDGRLAHLHILKTLPQQKLNAFYSDLLNLNF